MPALGHAYCKQWSKDPIPREVRFLPVFQARQASYAKSKWTKVYAAMSKMTKRARREGSPNRIPVDPFRSISMASRLVSSWGASFFIAERVGEWLHLTLAARRVARSP